MEQGLDDVVGCRNSRENEKQRKEKKLQQKGNSPRGSHFLGHLISIDDGVS